MTRTLGLLLLAATLGGCASGASKGLPVCDGQHRRPANPYGSVLDAASPPPAAAAVVAPPAPIPPPAAEPPASSPGCGS